MIVQERNKTNWMDAYICESKEDAKKYIEKQIQEGKRAEDFRIITNLIECQTKVVFINETEKSAQFIETENTPKRKSYTEENLKLLYFKRSCELMRWAKSTDFFDAEGYPTWTTFNNYLGNITNVKDLVVRELKKEPMARVYRELIDKYFDRYTSGLKVLEEFKGR